MRDPVTKLCYFNTPAKNMEAAQEVMFDRSLDRVLEALRSEKRSFCCIG